MIRPLIPPLALALLAGAALAQPKLPTSAAQAKERLASTITFTGVDDPVAAVADVLELIKKRYAVNVEIRAAAFAKAGLDKPGDVKVGVLPPMNASLDRVLRKVIARLKVGAVIAVVGATIQITTEEDLRARRITPTPPPVLKARRSDATARLKAVVDFPGIDDPKATLGEVLEMLRQKHRIQIDVYEEAFAVRGVNDILNARLFEKELPKMKAPLGKILDAILARIKTEDDKPAVVIGGDGTLVITTQKIGEKPISLRAAGGA